MMSIKDGLAGKILRINLTAGKITTESLDSNTFHQFLMGTGYAAKILWDELEAGIDPLGDKNKLVLSTGILTATGCRGSDSLFSCFHSYLIPGSDPQRYPRILSAVTGWELDFEELMQIGERVSNLQRCFNVREGIRRKDDMIPERLKQPPAFGPFSDRPETQINNYDAMLDEYYLERGWEIETGIATDEKVKALNLDTDLARL
jgi:aldehyde:ferredoxin oxidoreductase